MSRVVLLPGQTRIDYGREKAERALAIQEESMQMQAAHSTYDVMLQDNSFDGHRGWGNGLLYTSGKAQRIRAIDEAGLKACYDESDALWEVSLETPTERPEYALESLQLKTDHTLCVVCKDTLNYYCKYIDGSNKVRRTKALEGKPTDGSQLGRGFQRHFLHDEQYHPP